MSVDVLDRVELEQRSRDMFPGFHIRQRIAAISRSVAIVAICCLIGCGDSSDDPNAAALRDGHQKMLAILKDIKDRAPVEHQYFGRGAHEEARQRLHLLGPQGDKRVRFETLNELGFLELCYEVSPRKAIEHLTEAYELLSEVRFPDRASRTAAHLRVRFYLGLSYLRLGEKENCCLRNSAEGCILPIRGEGIHTETEGSRNAIRYFGEVLEHADPNDVQAMKHWYAPARWLMNIAYMTLDEYPDGVPEAHCIPPSFFSSAVDFPAFPNVGPKLGLETFNQAGGAIVDDFNNDDLLDIFESTSNPTDHPHFFINNGDGTFSDRTEEAGLSELYGGLNLVQADYDNDGNVDIFVLRGAWHGKFGRQPNSLLKNNGKGEFTDVTFAAGLGEVHYPTKTASWADYDNDGDVDLFVGNESNADQESPSQLFRNNGNGTFTDVAEEAGVQVRLFVMACIWGDYDQDGYADLYISSGSSPRLYRNRGNGTFENVAPKLGINRPKTPFTVWFWDFDNDGTRDLYVSCSSGDIDVLSLGAISETKTPRSSGFVELATREVGASNRPIMSQYEIAALYRGDGKGGFTDVSGEQNLMYPTEPMGANFGDLNGDGYQDFYLATGNLGYEELRPNVMFLNRGGTGFDNVTMGGGFGHLQKGHGVCFADIDNDGDQDVYVQMGGQLPGDRFNDALFENPGFGTHWLTVKLVGVESNKSAIGAQIHVRITENGKQRSIYKDVNSGGSFGCNPLRQNIGLGSAEIVDSLEITWPVTGRVQLFKNVPVDRTIQIIEGETKYSKIAVPRLTLGGSSEV